MKTMAKTQEETKIHMMTTKDLWMGEPFESLSSAPTDSAVQAQTRISEYIELHGYEDFQPIVVWPGDRNIVIHGFQWVRGALRHQMEEVPVIEKDFENEDQAVEHLRHLRRDKADWTDADIFIWVEHYKERRNKGRPPKNVSSETFFIKPLERRIRIAKNEAEGSRFNPDDPPEKYVRDIRKTYAVFQIARYRKKYKRTSERIADELNTDRNIIDRCWYILDHGDEQTKDYIRRGWQGINTAYAKLKRFKKGVIFYSLKFRGLNVRIPVRKDEDVDPQSFRWIILGTEEPPDMNQLPEGSRIYYREG